MDRGDLEKLLDEICEKVARLTVIQQDTQLQDDVASNSMSIHPKKVENDTIPLEFVLNLYSIFIVLRHVKIQNFRLLPLIVFELWDFKF